MNPSSQEDLFVHQIPVDKVDDRVWDVVVVGAGPAGSTAAYHLSRSGYSVLLADREQFPRQKVCGDCMITDVDTSLERLGVQETIRQVGRELKGLTIYSPSRVSFDIPGNFVTLKRLELDALLVRNAVDAGASFVRGHATDVIADNDQGVAVVFRHYRRPVKARIAVVATGASLSLAKMIGADIPLRPSALAMRCYIRCDYPLGRLILSYDRSILPGYRWIVPLGTDEFNIGCGCFLHGQRKNDIRECFDRFVTEFPAARDLWQHGERVSPPRSGALRCGMEGAQPLIGRRVLLAGETIGTTFPLTGEGIGQAMTTGYLAASTIDSALSQENPDLLKQYPQRLQAEVAPRHQGFKHAQKWMSKVWVNDLMARRVRKSSFLRDRCAAVIAANGDPRDLYSVKAVLRSYIG